MLRLTALLQNKATDPAKATEPAPATDPRVAEVQHSRAKLHERRRAITQVDIPAAHEANDIATVVKLRAERAAIDEHLAVLAEAETNARRLAASDAVKAQRQQLEDERIDIEAKLRAHGEAIDALGRMATERWAVYEADWKRYDDYNSRAKANSRSPELATEMINLEQATGLSSHVLGFVKRFSNAHTEVVRKREWNAPEAVARRAAEEAQERARLLAERNTREARKRRGFQQRFTLPPSEVRP